jgi:PAS domain S-box-containing protein
VGDGAGGDDFSTLFEFLPIGAYRTRPDGVMLRANPALVRLNGFDSEAEQLAAVSDIAGRWYVDSSRRAAFQQMLEREGRVIGFESEIHRYKTRERIWISENAHLVRGADGQPLYFEGTVEEITQRVAVQRALLRSEQNLQQITARVPGALYRLRLHADGRRDLDFMSDGVQDLLGISAQTLQREFRPIARMRHPQDRERVMQELQRSNAANEALSIEYRIVLDDGREKWIHQASTPGLPEEDGSRVRFGVMLDITERKLADALRQQRDQAAAADQAKSLFLSRVSHELRTPLNAILGFAQLLQMRGSVSAGSREHAWLAQMLASGGHLLALMDDILDLSSAQTGQMPMNLVTLELAPLARDTLAMAEPDARHSGITLHDALPAQPLWLRADATRLRQVLGNLLSNAAKYNRRDGWVRLEAAPWTDAAGKNWVEVAVADSGPGLSAASQARLFQPFERVGAERGPVAGTGLGLALVRQLSEAMGGEVGVVSAPDAGARFWVRLPAAEPPAPSSSPAPPTEPAAG